MTTSMRLEKISPENDLRLGFRPTGEVLYGQVVGELMLA
jgi:hypothetical protein